MKLCIKCEVVLTDKNWYPSERKRGNYICKRCYNDGIMGIRRDVTL